MRASCRAALSTIVWIANLSAGCTAGGPPASSGRFEADPPFRSALRDERALPSRVLGPVACSHGRQVQIACDCRARRFGVHPFAIPLQ